MKRVTLAIAVSFFLLAAPVYADVLVSATVGYQTLEPRGVFSGKSTGDTAIDMGKDLNFDNSNGVTAEVALSFGNSRLSIGYMPIRTAGIGNALSLTFNGQTFSGSVAGKLDADCYHLGYTYYLVNQDDTPLNLQLGLEVAVKIFDGEASITGTVASPTPKTTTESVSGTVPIPTLGARGRGALGDFFGIAARVGYMGYSGNNFLDAEAQLEFSPTPLIGLYGGYRIIDVEVDEFDGFLDAELSGPFAGAFVRF